MKEIIVEKIISDNKMLQLGNTFVKPSQINLIVNEDVDVYTKDRKLLLRFRKNLISKQKLDDFYDATYNYTVSNTSKNRGSAQGSQKKGVKYNKPIKSAIIGYFDKWAPNHKHYFKQHGIQTPISVRETSFNSTYPDKMKKAELLIKEIDKLYKQLLPEHYKKQIKKARQTHFKIANTSFTTVTTNINFRTSIHKDKGDDIDGFGNLAVIQRGSYSGGETCLPQYGIGVNVREGDILFMDVHEWHGNLPTKFETPNAVRMSIVCYLRTDIWKKTKGKTKHFKERHLKTIRRYFGKIKTRITKKAR